MHKLFCAIVVLFILNAPKGSAQTDGNNCKFVLKGNIRDIHSSEELEYASIYIQEIKRGAVCDSKGFFMIENLCSGNFTLNISHIGCQNIVREIFLSSDTSISIQMDHKEENLDEVEVTDKINYEVAQINKTEMNAMEMQELQGLPLGEMLKTMAGVYTINTGATISKPVVHGLHSNRLLILNNGIRQEGQQWGSEHAPEIDPYTTNSVQLSEGVDALQYASDAFGGVLILLPEELPKSPSLSADISLGAFSNNRQGDVNGSIKGMLSKKLPIAFDISGSLKKGGNVKTPLYYQSNTGVEENNYSIYAGIEKKKIQSKIYYSQFNQILGIYANSHIGNLTDLKNAILNVSRFDTASFTYKIERPNQEIFHELFKSETIFQMNEKNKFHLILGRQFDNRKEFDTHIKINNSDLNYSLTTHTGDLGLTQKYDNGIVSLVGINAMIRGNTYEGSREFIPNYKNKSGGIYLIETYHTEKWCYKLGMRYDVNNTQVFSNNESINRNNYNFHDFSGGLGIEYIKSNNVSITANASTLWRAPAVTELFSRGLHHGAAALEFGDQNLQRERIYNLTFGINYKRDQKFDLMVKPFLYLIKDYINLNPTSVELTIRGAFPAFNYKQADALFSGTDIEANFYLEKKWVVNTEVSFLYVRNLEDKNFFTQIPPGRLNIGVRKQIIEKGIFKNIFFGTAANWTLKQYFAPVGLVKSDFEKPQQIAAYSVFDFAPAPKGYLLANLQSGFDLKVKNQLIHFIFSADNILNTAYRNYMNRFRYYTDEMGRNFSVRIKIPMSIIKKS